MNHPTIRHYIVTDSVVKGTTENCHLLLISETFEFIINLPLNALWICNNLVNNCSDNFNQYDQSEFQQYLQANARTLFRIR
jgi:hypothetical protein